MKKKDAVLGLAAAVLVAIFLAPLASPWPDGLERVAENLGFLRMGEIKPVLISPFPDYLFPGIGNEKFATAIAGALGTLLLFAVGCGIAILLRWRRP